MRRAAVTGLLAIAACSPSGQPAPAPSTQAEAQPTAAAATGPVAPPIGTASGMKAEISPLRGDISDFKVTVSKTETIVELPADILFAFDSADLAPAAQSPLQRTADLIAKGGQGDIRVAGHTDAKGEVDYNIDLSKRRARSVADWLSAHGVAAPRLKPEGRGEAEPVAPNEGAGGADNPAGRALNRRVVIYIPR